MVSTLGMLSGESPKVFIVDLKTGDYEEWDGITEITEGDIIAYEEETAIEIKRLFNEPYEISMEFREMVVDKVDEIKRPNPVYIPKHIARRKKW